jgi:uncharacterized protein YecT (DUF1311 family)
MLSFLPVPALAMTCAKAETKIEKAICGSDELVVLDERLQKDYDEAQQRLGEKSQAQLTALQKGWLKNLEHLCVKKDYMVETMSDLNQCLYRFYTERIKEFEPSHLSSANPGPFTSGPLSKSYAKYYKRAPSTAVYVDEKDVAPTLNVGEWLDKLKAATSLDELKDAMSSVQPGFDFVVASKKLLIYGNMEPQISEDKVNPHLKLSFQQNDFFSDTLDKYIVVTIHLVGGNPWPNWFWMGAFRDLHDGDARLVSSFQNFDYSCGYAKNFDYKIKDGIYFDGLDLTHIQVAACGTSVVTYSQKAECFMSGSELLCISGELQPDEIFDRVPPAGSAPASGHRKPRRVQPMEGTAQ